MDFVINLSDPVNPATVQASDFTVNGIPANTCLQQRQYHDHLPLQHFAGERAGPADDAYRGRRI